MPKIDRPDPNAAVEEWLVYADALQIEEDPLGVLIMLNHQGDTTARDAHLSAHEEAIFGAIAPHWHKLGIAWRHCLAETIDLNIDPNDDPHALLAALLASPIAPTMRRLRLIAQTPTPSDRIDLGGALTLLAEDLPASCTALDLVDARARDARIIVSDYYDPGPNLVIFGSLDAIWAVRHLEELALHTADMGQVALGTIDAPALRSFTFCGLRWEDAVVPALAAARWPRLQRLALRLSETFTVTWPNQDGAYVRLERYDDKEGIERYGWNDPEPDGANWPSVLGPLLDALKRVPLVDLSLTAFSSSQPLLRALEAHGLPPTLRHLDLSGSDLDDNDLKWMVARPSLFAQLATLDLRETLISDASVLSGPDVRHSSGGGALYRFSVGVE